MTMDEIIRQAIDTAISGTDVDANLIQKSTLEAETLLEQALHELASEVAANKDLRARLTREDTVPLTNGVGTLPAGTMVEFLHEGSVRDGDPSANAGFGNILQRVPTRNAFYSYLTPLFGYYFLGENDQIYTRQIATGDFISTLSPLKINAPFVPSKANLDTEVDSEISDNLVKILAVRLRGFIDRQLAMVQGA